MKFSKEEKAMWIADWKQSRKSAWSYANENRLCPNIHPVDQKRNREEGVLCGITGSGRLRGLPSQGTLRYYRCAFMPAASVKPCFMRFRQPALGSVFKYIFPKVFGVFCVFKSVFLGG
jgi:hypothetical protein